MRKIISILLALGLVLGLSVMAMPVSANVSAATVTLGGTGDSCACKNATYNISFSINADLHSGTHSISILFPAGTYVPPTGSAWANGDISLNGTAVFGSEVTVTAGPTVTFLVPVSIVAPGPVWVFFSMNAGIKNPCLEGAYNVYVSTSRAPDVTPVKSATYNIKPAVSDYKFVWDFSPTYPGIAPNFVPPFKACGQADNVTGEQNAFNTTYNSTLRFWLNQFNLTLTNDGLPGCANPCTNVTFSICLASAPAGATLTLGLNGTWISLMATNCTTVGNITLNQTLTITWPSLIHVNMVGDYSLCFKLVCPAGTPDCYTVPPCTAEAVTITENCMPIKAYQWKDAYKIPLYRKWNLVSLPLVPFDTDISDILAALPAAVKADILCIWNFDQGTDKWFVWGAGCPPGAGSALTTMVDGKSYWIRAVYNATALPGTSLGSLWVWGTKKPVPPNAPSAYPVYTGWNMIGFTEVPPLSPMLATTYLAGVGAQFVGWGTVEAWNATTQTWWVGPANLTSGNGYWLSVLPATGGTIYPP